MKPRSPVASTTGLEAGIKGGIHAIVELWQQHKEEEEWGFLLVDASNAFNELNQTSMLWMIQHEWPSGAWFAFNCYCHWGMLVICGKGGLHVPSSLQGGGDARIPPLHAHVWDWHSASDPTPETGILHSGSTLAC
jgi:hypothetical protein